MTKENIFKKVEKGSLVTIEEVKRYLSSREQNFFEKLQKFALLLPQIYKNKIQDVGFTKGEFDATNLCIAASGALDLAMGKLLDREKFAVYGVSLDLHPLHQMIVVTARDNYFEPLYYIDPTYGQINPKYKNKILVFLPNELSLYYNENITHTSDVHVLIKSSSLYSLKNIPPQAVLDSLDELEKSLL